MKKSLIFLILTILLIAVLGACGNSENNGDRSNANATMDEAVGTNEVIRIAMQSEIDSLDPYQSAATDTESMLDNVFDGLVDTNESGELVPNLATDYEISEDHLTYTFQLVENAVFHNGAPVTAEDVVYSYSKLAGLDTGEPLSDKWEVVESVEAVGDYEVVITLKNIDSGFLARTISPIVPKDYEEQANHPIGAGPFKFAEHKVSQELVLERNNDYYLEDKIPEITEVRFVLMPDEETSILAMRSGEIDIIPGISEQGLQQLGDTVTTVSGPQNMVVVFGLNHTVEPLHDVKVRQAINMAIDKDQIIDTVIQGNGVKVDSNFSPAMEFYYEDGVENYYEVDIEQAKELLAEAGYPDGFNLTMTVPSHNSFYIDTAQMIAEQLKEIGVTVELQSIEWTTWLEQVYTNFDHESTIIGFTGKIDPYDVLVRFMDGYSRNFINYSNSEFDAAMENAILEIDDDARAAYYKEAQTILTEDAASVFMMDPNRTIAMRDGITGLKMYPMQKFNLEDITVTK